MPQRTTRRAMREPLLMLARRKLSGHEPLPSLIHVTQWGPVPALGVDGLYFTSTTYEVCVRCHQGPVVCHAPQHHSTYDPRPLYPTPRRRTPTPLVSTDPRDQAIHWLIRYNGDLCYINVHLRCLTPPELVWLWTRGLLPPSTPTGSPSSRSEVP